MDYYSPFWGRKMLSMVVEPQGVLCVGFQNSLFGSILARFMDYYSPFWGPKAISMVVELQDALTLLIKNHSLVRFWPISWTITLF